MRTLCKIMFLLNIVVQGCSTVHNSEYPGQFSSSNDTIILRTVKVKGSGLFSLGAGTLTFRDTTEHFEYPVTYPQDISNLKGIQMTTDFRSAEVDYIDIITGRKENKDIFIVDQNDNKDFTDDSVRVFRKMDWRSSENSIKCKYYIRSGEEIDSDSSWVKIGTQNGRILYGRDEHLTVDFHIDNVPYKIGIIKFRWHLL